ncbi:hypothetical protein [Rhodoferax sp. BAB1]|uniref:N-acyl amino acid synthase FeeM domain-containing protein n=1 Tax=Rhodoferax sp. BAB1 TaxID=2741720 RepID=UPI0015770DE0|nr:hypothetical protein [Rhodoferax sp. BAB1]QKO21738.1 hypothetical protein HTY51_07455 [Rhodoferax sp. BAB1]
MSTNLLGTEVSVRSMPIPPAYLEPEEDQPVPANEQYLPFTVRQASNTDDLRKVVEVRQRAYARHLPLVAETLKTPEQDDTEDGVVLLIAESKVDGSALGTVRIQTNRVNPLNLEQFVALPDGLRNKTIAEVRRLGVAHGMPGRLVRMLLLKAVYQYCAHNHVDWILVGARPPLDRMYEQLTLADVLPGKTFLPKQNNIPHRVLGLEVRAFHDRLVASNNPLLEFFFYTQHPDIQRSCLEPRSWSGDEEKMKSTFAQHSAGARG